MLLKNESGFSRLCNLSAAFHGTYGVTSVITENTTIGRATTRDKKHCTLAFFPLKIFLITIRYQTSHKFVYVAINIGTLIAIVFKSSTFCTTQFWIQFSWVKTELRQSAEGLVK